MISSSAFMDISDDLVYSVTYFVDTPPTYRNLIFVSKRFLNLFYAHYYAVLLFGSDNHMLTRTDCSFKLMVRLIDLSASDKSVPLLVRTRATRRKAIELVDHVLQSQKCPEIVGKFVKQFNLTIFQDIVPGLFCDWRKHHLEKQPVVRQITLHNVFGLDTRKKRNRIQVKIHPDIDALFEKIASGRSVLQPSRHRSNFVTREPLFGPSLFKIHERFPFPSEVTDLILERFGSSTLLRNPDILWGLCRIGFRIPLESYLKKFSPSPKEIALLGPFLSPWGTIVQGFLEFHRRFYDRNFPFLVRLAAVQTLLHEDSLELMQEYLQQERFRHFRIICRYVSWRCFPAERFPVPLLETALRVGAPQDVLNYLWACPPHRLMNFNPDTIKCPEQQLEKQAALNALLQANHRSIRFTRFGVTW